MKHHASEVSAWQERAEPLAKRQTSNCHGESSKQFGVFQVQCGVKNHPTSPPPVSGEVPDFLPAHTQREIRALKADIEAVGLIDPIVADDNGNIIDGRLRARLCDELGIDWHRDCDVRFGLTNFDKVTLRFRFNEFRRSNRMSKDERQKFVSTLIEASPELSDSQIAELARVSRSTVQNDRNELAKSGRLPERTSTVGMDGKRRKLPTKKRYQKKVTVQSSRQYERICADIHTLGDDAPTARTTPLRLNIEARRKQSRANAIAASSAAPIDDAVQLFEGDFRNLPVEPHSVDLIFTDVVWFEDAADDWHDLAELAHEQWLKPGGYFCSYISQSTLIEFCNHMAEFLTYKWQIAVKFQSRGSRSTSALHKSRIFSSWRPIVLFSNSASGNIRQSEEVPRIYDYLLSEKYEKVYHDWQQPLTPTRDVIRMLCPENGLVCDPFMGTGTTAVATRQLRNRYFIGGDHDPEQVAISRHRVATEGREAAPASHELQAHSTRRIKTAPGKSTLTGTPLLDTPASSAVERPHMK